LASLEYLQNGRYAVLKKLGEGGKGIVYKARDTMLNRVVAIKMLKSAVTEGEAYSRFIIEAQAVAKLNHPNIVSIYDIGKEDSKQFFVLEFVDGQNFRDLMKTYPEGKCDIQVILRIGIDICSALQYAHSHGVLHRDIKPENVMITKEEIAKLMDFGLARILDQPGITHEDIIVGSVAYVAPENALGKMADARSDLYSLGAMLYEAFTGRPPFPGEDPVKVIFGHVHDYPIPVLRLNSRVPQALADCVMKLLEKEPERRYQTAKDLLEELKVVARQFSEEISTRPSTSVPFCRSTMIGETHLIDRVKEMGAIREAIDRATRNEGSLVFLSGEAGIGKTRLTKEASAYAHLRGMRVLHGRYPALLNVDDVPPYVLWSEVIKEYVTTSTLEQLGRAIGPYPAEVCKVFPEIKQKLLAIPNSLPISQEHEQHRLFEAISQFITNISKDNPLLVVLDDLQWADQSSLLVLHYLARGIENQPFIILGAYRDADIDQKNPLSPILLELNRERLLQTITLKRLSPDEILDMTKQVFERDDVPKEFSQLVYEKTKGNPFFFEEVMKSLKEELIIYREGNSWRAKDVSSIELPKSVRSVVKSRIERLDDECQNLLVTASIIGERFSFEILRQVLGTEESRLAEVMEKILKTGLIKENVVLGEDVYFFADVMTRDVLYGETSHLKRKRLHNSVGCALEKVYADKIEQHFGELAYHFLESGDKDRALDYFLKAGEKAANVYANTQATSYFQSALTLLIEKKSEIQERGRVLEKLGDTKKLVGEYHDCLNYWKEALLLFKQLDENEVVARLYRKMAKVIWSSQGDTKKARTYYEDGLKILEKGPESAELASLFDDLSRLHLNTDDVPKGISWAEKSLELAKKLDAQETIANSYDDMGLASYLSGDIRKSVEYHKMALKIALDNGYVEAAIRAYSHLYWSVVYLQAMGVELNEEDLHCGERAYELAKKVGDIHWVSSIGTVLSDLYESMGNLNDAFSLAIESAALARKTGDTNSLTGALNQLGSVLQTRGEWDKSEQHCREALGLAEKTKDLRSISIASHLIGGDYIFKGMYAESTKYMEKAVEAAEKAGARNLVYYFKRHLAWSYIKLRDSKKAQDLLNEVLKFASQEDPMIMAWADSLMGMLFRDQKKWNESITFFEKSLRENESFNSRRFRVYYFARFALYEYACMYLERDQPGDREKADKLLDQALEVFQKVDNKKDMEMVIAKKKLLTA
jgi:serine/threonine protein kinase/tetratricopeptide (TPR) repeat protein